MLKPLERTFKRAPEDTDRHSMLWAGEWVDSTQVRRRETLCRLT